jgi:hypothetical protein
MHEVLLNRQVLLDGLLLELAGLVKFLLKLLAQYLGDKLDLLGNH